MNDKEQLEQTVSRLLTEGEMKQEAAEEAARKRISPKYEVRVQATFDPIVEETKLYREKAREVDGRYDAYMSRTKNKEKK